VRPRASEGIHFANVGGMWQEVVLGFAGMVNALGADKLTFNPCMPDEIESLFLKVIWKGQKVEVSVTKSGVSVRNLSEKDIEFSAFGKTSVVAPDKESLINA